MPGVVLLLPRLTIGEAIDEMEYLALTNDPEQIRDLVVYLPQP
jgi:hypothetical protein